MKQPIGKVYEDKHGHLIASIHLNGKQHLKRVKTREQAQEWFLCLQTQSTQAASLTFQQLNDAANALTMLRNAGASLNLQQVVKEWLNGASSASQCQETICFADAITQYLERSSKRVGPLTMKDYRLQLGKFNAAIGGDRMVSAFKKPDALKFLDRFLNKPPTWWAYQRTLSRFFKECVSMEWCEVNPFTGLTGPMVKPPRRTFLSVEDARKALASVMKRRPELIHFLTLGLFAGIRPIESLRLTKDHVNLNTGYIHLDAGITKSHSFKERVIPINDTLRAWLKACPYEGKPIPATNICFIDRVMQKCAKLDGWSRSPDCLRHSYCTYQFALTGNSAETASLAGHSESICMKHYRGRVTKDEAIKYFDILPPVC